jgi:predicted lipid-binding transport protein (Tim44 family)
MKLLLAIFLFFGFIFLFGFSILRIFLGKLFGIDQRPPRSRQSQSREKQKSSDTSSSASKKIIASDEGEYVDYVEIKD